MKYAKALFLTLSVVALSTPGCLADPVTYTYTGNPFTTVLQPYSTADFISVSLTLAQPLSANVMELDGTPSSSPIPLQWSESDGVHTFTDSSAGAILNDGFGTDASGHIVTWTVSVYSAPNGYLDTAVDTAGNHPFYGTYDESFTETPAGYGRVNDDPGTWTLGVPLVTPEPSSFWLLATGVLGACVLRRVRRAGQEMS